MHALILYLAMTSIGADAYTTQHNWCYPNAHEVNPIAQLFTQHGTPARISYFTASAAVLYLGDRKLSHRHKRLAVLGALAVIGAESYWTNYNIRHGKGW